MAKRYTREKQYVRLPEKRIREIEDLVASWSYETKAFMRARLNQYHPPSDMLNTLLEVLLSLFMSAPEKKFAILKDPEILTDWEKRFEISGQTIEVHGHHRQQVGAGEPRQVSPIQVERLRRDVTKDRFQPCGQHGLDDRRAAIGRNYHAPPVRQPFEHPQNDR